MIMSPTGGETSWQHAELVTDLNTWAKQDGMGIVFGASAGFILPNGSVHCPTLAWIHRSRLEALTTEEKKNFIPLCPDFIIELRSPIEPLEQLKEKMAVYIKNGLQLGWLIDPEEKQVFVYQATGQITHLENPTSLSGEPLLAGFVLDPRGIWIANF
jgi:Uma2 family endonuclease